MMKDIKRMARQFRNAIDKARDAGEFDKDFSFYKFPCGCCGDTCELLAQFLLENGITTFYVWGMHSHSSSEGPQSHAWLLAHNHTIIDITGDQFRDNPIFLNYDKSVYVGDEDDFHRLFRVNPRDIKKTNGIGSLASHCQPRLFNLYDKIIKHS